MARRRLTANEFAFEHLRNSVPEYLVDQHPDGVHIILQFQSRDSYGLRAGIWSAQDRKVILELPEITTMHWNQKGDELLAVREKYRHHPEQHGIIATPLQSEFTYMLERRAWPSLTPIDQCSMYLPTGWPVDLAVAPDDTQVCCVWEDQREAGIEFFEIQGTSVRQLADRGFCGQYSNLFSGPSYSPDGRFLVFAFGKYAWWSPDDPETPSQGGNCTVGWVVVHSVGTAQYRIMELTTNLAKGWLPEDPNDLANMKLSAPIFVDDRFAINLPTGEQKSFETATPG